VLEVGVPARVVVHLGDVELVAEVAVNVRALRLEGRERLPCELERDRDVEQELARARVRDHGALVADDGVLERGGFEVRAHRAEHPPRHDDERNSGCAYSGDRGDRPG
jgi:hypothetical protein